MDQVYSLTKLLLSETSNNNHHNHGIINASVKSGIKAKDAIEFISKISGVKVKPKFASSIAVRVGRPEKAPERKMKPPVHVLFPIGI